jgi:hypothetical protein
MDQDMLRMLAQFRILMKREAGLKVDLQRLVDDADYARQTLSAGEDSDSEALVTLALSLRDRLGLLQQKPVDAGAKADPDLADPAKGKRHFYGARS